MRSNYRRRSKKTTAFNPTSKDLASAVLEFQKEGGSIQKLEARNLDMAQFLNKRDERAVDDFLMPDLNRF